MIAAWQRGRRGERYILAGHDMTYRARASSTIAREAGVAPPRLRRAARARARARRVGRPRRARAAATRSSTRRRSATRTPTSSGSRPTRPRASSATPPARSSRADPRRARVVPRARDAVGRLEARYAPRVADYDAPTAVDTSPRASDKPVEPALDERYEVGDVLGRGGMGEVRLAHDERIGRDVAIKLMRAGAARRRDDRAVLARGAHPGPARAPRGRAGARARDRRATAARSS